MWLSQILCTERACNKWFQYPQVISVMSAHVHCQTVQTRHKLGIEVLKKHGEQTIYVLNPKKIALVYQTLINCLFGKSE